MVVRAVQLLIWMLSSVLPAGALNCQPPIAPYGDGRPLAIPRTNNPMFVLC